jgi:glycerol uptake facilitator-like aquaporin
VSESDLGRRAAAEAIGAAMLLAAVVGSGIMAERLAGGNAAIALLANAIATGGALVALILTFGGISGAHFNPVVTMIIARRDGWRARDAVLYMTAQTGGALGGVGLAHAMFGLPLVQLSTHARATFGEWLGEFVATFGLVGLILSCAKHAPKSIPFAVAAYITGAYWFTSSTSFANPAVTLARSFTNTFAGIEVGHMPAFVVAELIGGAVAALVFRWLLRPA